MKSGGTHQHQQTIENLLATKTLKIQDENLAKQLEMQREQTRLQQQRKRNIYETICELSDPVEESVLLKHLSILDLASWAEVIEERFLGRLCGYPVCTNSIIVDFRRKYTILKHPGLPKQYVPIDAEPNKFCSLRCMCMARAVAVQLDSEEMHLTRLTAMMTSTLEVKQELKPKQFSLLRDEEWRKFLQSENANNTEKIFKEISTTTTIPSYSQAELIKRLHDFKLADNEEEDANDEENLDEDKETSDSEQEEEKLFTSAVKSLSITPSTSVKSPQQKASWKRGFLLEKNQTNNENDGIKNDYSNDKIEDKCTGNDTTNITTQKKHVEKNKAHEKLLGDVIERVNEKWTMTNKETKTLAATMRSSHWKKETQMRRAKFNTPICVDVETEYISGRQINDRN